MSLYTKAKFMSIFPSYFLEIPGFKIRCEDGMFWGFSFSSEPLHENGGTVNPVMPQHLIAALFVEFMIKEYPTAHLTLQSLGNWQFC